jgi:energy-coupling factor transporter ATP-binding protein EcfA2
MTDAPALPHSPVERRLELQRFFASVLELEEEDRPLAFYQLLPSAWASYGGHEVVFRDAALGMAINCGIDREDAGRMIDDTRPTQPNGAASSGTTDKSGKKKDEQDGPKLVKTKTLGQFVAEYVALSYIVEPWIRDASLYSLTGRTGCGKTSFLVILAIAVAAASEKILGRQCEQGRVAFLTAENPDDLRMKFMVVCTYLQVDFDSIKDRIIIIDRREKPEDAFFTLSQTCEFRLVVVDTFAAYFDGKNVNDAVEGGEFMRRCRPFTTLRGKPAVLVACHPVKNALEDNLIPYGSGAILNEADGNLTLWKSAAGPIALHHQGKLRGIEFDPVMFRIEITGSPDVLDKHGRQVLLPVMVPTTTDDAEKRQQEDINIDAALLRAMIAKPEASQSEWAGMIGRNKSRVSRRLPALKVQKLVDEVLGRWAVTKKGRDAIKPIEA